MSDKFDSTNMNPVLQLYLESQKKVFNIFISKNISEKMFRLGTLFLVLSEYIQGNSGGLQKTQFIKRGQKSFLAYIAIISAMKFWRISPSYPPWSFGVYHHHIRYEVLAYITIIYAPKFWCISPSYQPWSFGVYHHHIRPEVLVYITIISALKF